MHSGAEKGKGNREECKQKQATNLAAAFVLVRVGCIGRRHRV